MDTLIINQDQVEQLLSMDVCIPAMEAVLRDLSEGDCELPLRQILWLPERRGAFAVMPSAWESTRSAGLKAVTFFHQNEGTERDTHQGAVLLFETERGCLQAVMDATSITAIRTAAVSGAATRALARREASVLALVGSGVQARTHLDAMCTVRPIESVRVCSKTLARAQAFAQCMSEQHGVAIEAVATVEAAVHDADIICTVTSSSEPVLQGAWIPDGAHINAVGASVATSRELDSAAVKRSSLFVDRVESAFNEAGDFLLARQDGVVDDAHIVAELGDVIAGKQPGRQSDAEITLFKSVGLAVQDLAAARCVYDQARATHTGLSLDFGGHRRNE